MKRTIDLPQEIIGLIADNLSSYDNQKFLTTLALVSRIFRLESQRALFKAMDLPVRNLANPNWQFTLFKRHYGFLRAIQAQLDRLAPYVLIYTCTIAHAPKTSDTHVDVEGQHWARPALARGIPLWDLVMKVLPLLTNLRHLTFEPHNLPGHPILMNSSALLRKCHFSRLESITWSAAQDTDTLFTDFFPCHPTLQAITIHRTHKEHTLSPFQPASLMLLDLKLFCGQIEALACLHPDSNVDAVTIQAHQSIHMRDTIQSAPPTALFCLSATRYLAISERSPLEVIFHWAPNVEELRLHIPDFRWRTEPHVFKRLIKLRNLIIHFEGYFDNPDLVPDAWMEDIKSDAKQLFDSCSHLESIFVEKAFDNSDDPEAETSFICLSRDAVCTLDIDLQSMHQHFRPWLPRILSDNPKNLRFYR